MQKDFKEVSYLNMYICNIDYLILDFTSIVNLLFIGLSFISFNVKIIYLACSTPDVTVEGTLIYIQFPWAPVPICASFLISFLSLRSSPIHIGGFICCVNKINIQRKNPNDTVK